MKDYNVQTKTEEIRSDKDTITEDENDYSYDLDAILLNFYQMCYNTFEKEKGNKNEIL